MATFSCRAVMVLLVVIIGIGWPLEFAGKASATDDESVDLIIADGHVFDSESGEFKENHGIVVDDGKIVALTREGYEAALVVHLDEDEYVLPGLVDLHAHYNVRLNRIRREEFDVNPVLYLANGVTVTFTAGEYDPDGMVELKEQIASGEAIGPTILNAGPYFGLARPGWRQNTPTRDEIYEQVDHWARMGVGGFKAKLIDAESLQALIDRAHMHDLTVTGHLESGYRNSVNPKDAIAMGIDRIEHFLGGDGVVDNQPAYPSVAEMTPDDPEFKEIVSIYVEQGTYYDATITAFGYFGERGEEFDYWVDEREFLTPFIRERLSERVHRSNELFHRVYESKQKMIRHYFEAGGKITLGTDHFSSGDYVSGFCAHRELDAFVRAGIPAADAIRIGTINGAQAMGIDDERGSIEIGKFADLFVVSGDPIENIRNTRNVQWIMKEGVHFDREELLDSVRGKMGPENEEELSDW